MSEVERYRRATGFWRTLAITSWVVLALGALGAAGLFAAQRDQALRAMQAEADARAAAEQQLIQAQEETRRLIYAHNIGLAHQQLEQGNLKNAPE
jgi:hypothetical protein